MLLAILRRLVSAVHSGVHNDKWAPPLVEVGALILAIFIGVAVHRHYVPHITDVVQTTPDTKTVYVDKPVVSTNTVTKVIADPKDRATINTLLATNAALQGQIIQLTNTVASLNVHGGTDAGGTVTTLPTAPGADAAHEYKDWQLAARYQGTTFAYDLTQKFQVVTTTGKGKDGKRTELVNVFQNGPNGERIPVPAQTTAIIADNVTPHWFVRLNVQGGVNVSPGEPGAVVGLQWLKKGTSHAAEDQRWAAITPVVFASQNVKEIGMLPMSFNIGNIKHQPFTNLWVSPYVGWNPVASGLSRFGFALSSTF